jgi:hypothetical protein
MTLYLARHLTRTLLPLAIVAAVGWLLPACGGGGSAPGEPTYWTDVAPIYYDKCVRCHQAGGIGPFALDDYPSSKDHAAIASSMVEAGLMPPFLVDHSGSCGDFQDDETLSEAQKAIIKAWAAAGAPEGPPRSLTLPAVPHLDQGTDYRTPDFAPEPQGGTIAAHDEYRCFLIDSGLTAPRFITGYEVTPGNAAIVHHVLLFTVDPAKVVGGGMTNAAVMSALDAASPDRLGWPCFGAAGEGVDVESVPVTWAPGQGVVAYPGGVGVPMSAAEKIVVQIHYNLADPATHGMRDQTTVRLRFADSVQRRAVFLLPDPFLDSLNGPNPAMLPPNMASTTYTWNQSAQQLGLGNLPYVDVLGVMPHMHERGHRLELRHLTGGAGTSDAGACIAKVDAWDFHWQKMYGYRTAPRLTGTSALSVTCDYDTRGTADPVLPGWGTQNEMCLTALMVALPPGT